MKCMCVVGKEENWCLFFFFGIRFFFLYIMSCYQTTVSLYSFFCNTRKAENIHPTKHHVTMSNSSFISEVHYSNKQVHLSISMLIVHMPLHYDIACMVMIDDHWCIWVARKGVNPYSNKKKRRRKGCVWWSKTTLYKGSNICLCIYSIEAFACLTM